jgi:hypothetical protein
MITTTHPGSAVPTKPSSGPASCPTQATAVVIGGEGWYSLGTGSL